MNNNMHNIKNFFHFIS